LKILPEKPIYLSLKSFSTNPAQKMYSSENFRQKVKSILLSKNNSIRAAFLFGFASLSSWIPMFNLWLEGKGLTGVQIGIVAAIPWLLMLFI